jgi:hypothetical protein
VHLEKFLAALENPNTVEIYDVKAYVPDLMITDYLVEVSLDSESDFRQILIYAAQVEKKAHDLYISIAQEYKVLCWELCFFLFQRMNYVTSISLRRKMTMLYSGEM